MKKVIKIIFGASFIFYLLGLIFILFLNSRGGYWIDLTLIEYIKRSSNIVPFKTISLYVNAISDGSMNMDIPIKNIFGNLILFLPMGIYLPFFIKKIDKARILLIYMIILLFFIEILQLTTRKGSFDIDDFILNMLGGLIGYVFWKTKVIQKLLK
jgi:glycopeptide antibiotics resistance protein